MVEFQAPKGVPEYFPPRSSAFLAVREALAHPARCAGYGYIELPVFEDTSLFVRGVGESTDVVSKAAKYWHTGLVRRKREQHWCRATFSWHPMGR